MNDQTERDFHISRTSRQKYGVDGSIFKLSGNAIFASVKAARQLVQALNQEKGEGLRPEDALKTGDMVAMGLIDEILHHVVDLYRRKKLKHAMADALSRLDTALGPEQMSGMLGLFTNHFPPPSVYAGDIAVAAYLSGTTGQVSNREIALEEILLLWLANMNPAFRPFKGLFDDSPLKEESPYLDVIHGLREFFEDRPPFGPDDQHLVDMLRSPAIASPHSLEGQLAYIRDHWGLLIRDRYGSRILRGLDLYAEERKITFGGPGPSAVYTYSYAYDIVDGEYENFSPDRDWMPRVVLMAKNVYVWFDQLSKAYGTVIDRLDRIPDGELDRIQEYGFTGLWLIGIWERSGASQRIKQMCGNPEAVPSAYSLHDYEIARDLGGEEAYRNLRDRLTARGVRLASDMVPNHFGIDSRWLTERPDWFISLDHNPYPWYSFRGPDLSSDGRVGIFLEDHYYDRTDAAVTFKRLDRRTGGERFVYHGNDGTSMPWNDTAQLDYLNPDVREGMIEIILNVARRFPIIRFDAAMTLTKRHYQRLWFPEPGRGGAIPTRAENGMTKDEFNGRMPQEFWRQVVDRVAQEAPDTLLLAEAFWLLEGYFVRTLGMHRVYNSAFMNMLRDEENSKYRLVMKNTLEFDPEVLKRFVNFMNNPDERTAVDQFGKGDKYFGVCTMLATLPGLPMFGHGQVEGYTEKYGMEYRKAYFDETPDGDLVERHRREIFPLLRRRSLFTGVDHFLLYDFFAEDGTVNEDVFAYSNRYGSERTLVLYNNRYASARGFIRTSTAFSVASGSPEGRTLVRRSLAEGLSLTTGDDTYTIFRDHRRDLWFIRPNGRLAEEGLFVELGAYDHHVFLDFTEVRDNDWHRFGRLAVYLGDGGVEDLDAATGRMLRRDLRESARSLAADLVASMDAGPPPGTDKVLRDKIEGLVFVSNNLYGTTLNAGDAASVALHRLTAFRDGPALADSGHGTKEGPAHGNGASTGTVVVAAPVTKVAMAFWIVLQAIPNVPEDEILPRYGEGFIDTPWALGNTIEESFTAGGMDSQTAREGVTLAGLFSRLDRSKSVDLLEPGLAGLFSKLCHDRVVQTCLAVHTHGEEVWFSKERLEGLLAVLVALRAVEAAGAIAGPGSPKGGASDVDDVARLLALAEESRYRWNRFAAALDGPAGGSRQADYRSSQESE